MSAVSHSEHGMRARLPTPAARRRMLDGVAAGRVLSGRLDDVHDVVRLTADRFALKDALQSGKVEEVAAELARVARSEGPDFLPATDASGRVLLRTSNPGVVGDYRNHDPLIAAARTRKVPIAAVSVMAAGGLRGGAGVPPGRAGLPVFSPPPQRRPR